MTLDEDLVRFLDETTNNRSEAISQAIEQWRALQWQRRHLCTWPRNPLLRDGKRRPVVVPVSTMVLTMVCEP